MESILNFFLTYFNPTNFINMLWNLHIDAFYYFIQLIIDTMAGLVAGLNWLCPVMEKLVPPTPPPIITQMARHVAWVIPWNYAVDLVAAMMCMTMLTIMTSWTLRWMKVIK